MPHKIKEAVTTQELLAYSEDAFVTFMNKSYTKSRRFDVSRITDLDSLSSSELETLSQKLEWVLIARTEATVVFHSLGISC